MLYLQWAGDAWPEWKAHGNLWKFGQITMRFFLSPIILIWLYFDFFSNASKFFRAPINRCIHDFISYIYFMGLLAYEAYLLTCEETFNLHDTPCKSMYYNHFKTIRSYCYGHFALKNDFSRGSVDHSLRHGPLG